MALSYSFHTKPMPRFGPPSAPRVGVAPSAASTLGMSLGGTGTAVALETADVVLMGDNLALLPYAIRLSRRTLRTIKQNLVFAFGAMLLLLLATFSGSLRLPFAVAGHEGSTVLVILNGLRLLRRSKGSEQSFH